MSSRRQNQPSRNARPGSDICLAFAWRATAISAATLLSACASINGSARPVPPVETRVAQARALTEREALEAFYSDGSGRRGGLSQEAYRNMVIGVHVSAADAQYEAFRDQLSREAKGSGFGGNVAVLLMNAAAVVSGAEAARALAAGSSFVAGAQGALSKDLFYQQALPAVLAAMDANRATAQTTINSKLRLSAEEYTLAEAFRDIRTLEGQANLNAALQQLTTLATTDAAEKRAVMEAAYVAPLRGAPLVSQIGAVLDYVDGLKTSNAALLEAIYRDVTQTPADAALTADTGEQERAIRAWVVRESQNDAGLTKVKLRLKPHTGKESYP